MPLYRINKKEPSSKPLTQRCIILDLDETLVHSCEDIGKLSTFGLFRNPGMLDLRRRLYYISMGNYTKTPTIWGVVRPYTENFIQFCFEYFAKVCVWSAGLPEYVDRVVDLIFPSGYKPHLVYNRNHCHYDTSGEIFKPIEKMAKALSGEKEGVKLENTFFLDDRPQAFLKNPQNGIIIPPYEPEEDINTFLQEDDHLVRLMQWLSKPEVIAAKDVRLLDKSRIFI